MPRIAIIGGGLVGVSIGWRLLELGLDVIVIDREHGGQATAAGAGILPPLDPFVGADAVLPLLARARAFYPELVAALAAEGEGDLGYDVIGALSVATSAEELARLPELQRECERRRAEGFTHIGAVTRLEAAQARSLFPLLGPGVLGAVHCSGAARIDGRRLLAALRGRMRARGAALRVGDASIWSEAGRVLGVLVDGEAVGADAVVVAGGAWSSLVFAPLGIELPVVPQRGQLLHLEVPGHSTGRWPVVLGFEHQYLLAFPEARIVAGATREDGVGYDHRATVAGVRAVLDQALSLAPSLRNATIAEIRVGFRPVSSDRRPVLGAMGGYPNLFVATGHAGYGLEVGPYSGVVLAELIAGRTPPLDLAPFSPSRFVTGAPLRRAAQRA
jgi:D-amino-acid dehydrogenase